MSEPNEERWLSLRDYETIFHNVSDGIVIHPIDSQEVLDANERFAEMVGYTRGEVRTLTVPDLTADGWMPDVSAEERLRTARTEGHTQFEWRLKRKDGTDFWADVNLSVVTLDGEECLLSSARDISERKEQERRTRAIFDQTYQFTGLMTPDGTLVEANQTALDFGGLDREDVIGKSVWDCYWFAYSAESQRRAREAVRRAAEGEFVRDNVEVRGSEGTEIIDFSIRPVTDENGTVTLLIPEGREITELVEHRERLRVYNRVMRHNLRNKLTGINGFAGEIEAVTDDSRIESLADRILDASEGLEELGAQIREFDRLRKGKTTAARVDVDDLLTGLVADAGAVDGGETVRTAIDDGVVVDSDPRLLRLVLEQLLVNAVEHGGDRVRVSARHCSDGDGVEISVEDDGPGIPASEYEPLLDGTASQLEHTTGIGLLIVKWGVDELNGTLEITSDEEGTAVSVRLPGEM